MGQLAAESKSLIVIPYLGHNLACPFCNVALVVNVTVRVNEGDVRHVGTKGMDAVFSVNLDAKVAEVNIQHSCRGPRQEEN
jgi:hypothetical protein